MFLNRADPRKYCQFAGSLRRGRHWCCAVWQVEEPVITRPPAHSTMEIYGLHYDEQSRAAKQLRIRRAERFRRPSGLDLEIDRMGDYRLPADDNALQVVADVNNSVISALRANLLLVPPEQSSLYRATGGLYSPYERSVFFGSAWTLPTWGGLRLYPRLVGELALLANSLDCGITHLEALCAPKMRCLSDLENMGFVVHRDGNGADGSYLCDMGDGVDELYLVPISLDIGAHLYCVQDFLADIDVELALDRRVSVASKQRQMQEKMLVFH